MTTLTFSMVDETAGFKGQITYSLTDAEGQRVAWAYDHCFNCGGDPKVIFDTIATRLIATVVDHAHQYEMSQPRDPITPRLE